MRFVRSRNAFDEDIRDLVQVRVVHGFWKREDGRIQALEVWQIRSPLLIIVRSFLHVLVARGIYR